MKRKGTILFILVFTIWALSYNGIPSFAEEDVSQLKEQIEALQKRVEELESSKEKHEEDVSNFLGRQRGWDPFYEMERMQEQMNQMFQHSFGRSGLNHGIFRNDMIFEYDFDIKEEKDRYIITFDLTGLNEKNLDIEINESSITVKGQHTREETKQDPNSYFSSKSYGSFLKTIPVPSDADTTKAKTEKKGNSLIITLPKK